MKAQIISFNTQPRRGGCIALFGLDCDILLFQHTAAQRRLPVEYIHKIALEGVSTHSRAEAAARSPNTDKSQSWFQHTAAQRRLLFNVFIQFYNISVSTHSRAEAAAYKV